MPNLEKDFSFVDEWKSMWEPDLEAIAYNGATCDPTRVDPKVLQWVRQNCARKPHFIKVINKSASLGWHGHGGKSRFRMGVPRPFVRDHYKELGRVVTLENGISRKKWKVSFGSPKRNSSWLQGWRRVADDNSLKPGDVMIFVLVGHSHFRFHLFDEDGNVPGSHRQLPNTPRMKTEPSDTYHSHQEYALTDSDDEFKHKKLRRLFDPDLAIVKIEPGLFRRSASPEGPAPSWSFDHPNEQIIEPGLCEKSTVPGGFGLEIRSSPGSELTVADGEETIARGESVRDRNSAPNCTGQCVPDSPHIALNNVDTSAEKSVSTARCARTTSRQSDEGCEEGPVKRKLEFQIIETKSLKGGLCLANGGMISQQTPSFDQAREAPQQGTIYENPPAQKAPINPLAYFVKSKRRMTTPTERKRAWEVAQAHAKVLNGFHFMVVLSSAQVYTDFHLALPDPFVSESDFPTALTRLSLVDWTGGKSWEMFSKRNSCNEISFNRKYWGIFALEHFLEEDDVCVFGLENKDSFTFSVRIFRVLQLPKYLDRTGTVRDHYELRPKPKS